MKILLYLILIYILSGSIVYLIAIRQCNTIMTPFKTELFLFIGFVFKIVIVPLLMLDSYMTDRRKTKYIKFVENNPKLTEVEKEAIIKYVTEISDID